MFDGEMVLPIVREGLVERSVLLRRDFGRVASPEWFRLVEFDLFGHRLFHRLGLLLAVIVNLLNLGLVLAVL